MDNIYAKLYDIVADRLQEYGLSMAGSKETFCYSVEMEPGICDGKQLEKMENPMFLEAVYLGMLNRLPDEGAIAEWQYEMNKDADKFRQGVLNEIIPSTEALLKGSCFRNNRITESRQQELFRICVSEMADLNQTSDKNGQKLLNGLYKIYLKFPMRLRLMVRKILKRG